MALERTSHPVARKAHRCDGCDRTINLGERYHRWEAASDYSDGIETTKTCDHCHRLARDLWAADVRGEDDYGRECYAYLPELYQNDYDLPTEEPWPTRFALFRVQWETTDGLLATYPPDDTP